MLTNLKTIYEGQLGAQHIDVLIKIRVGIPRYNHNIYAIYGLGWRLDAYSI